MPEGGSDGPGFSVPRGSLTRFWWAVSTIVASPWDGISAGQPATTLASPAGHGPRGRDRVARGAG